MRWLERCLGAFPWLVLAVVLFPFAVVEWLLTPQHKRRPYLDLYWFEEDLVEEGERRHGAPAMEMYIRRLDRERTFDQGDGV
jgi:hypothetical protein